MVTHVTGTEGDGKYVGEGIGENIYYLVAILYIIYNWLLHRSYFLFLFDERVYKKKKHLKSRTRFIGLIFYDMFWGPMGGHHGCNMPNL